MTDQTDPPSKMKPRRAGSRDATFLKADARLRDGRVLEGLRVRNLSAGGLMIETPEPFDDDETIEIALRNIGWVRATVAWMAEGRVGLAFTRHINPEDVRRPATRSPGATMELIRTSDITARRPGLKLG